MEDVRCEKNGYKQEYMNKISNFAEDMSNELKNISNESNLLCAIRNGTNSQRTVCYRLDESSDHS